LQNIHTTGVWSVFLNYAKKNGAFDLSKNISGVKYLKVVCKYGAKVFFIIRYHTGIEKINIF
jgi:hypothetical protein